MVHVEITGTQRNNLVWAILQLLGFSQLSSKLKERPKDVGGANFVTVLQCGLDEVRLGGDSCLSVI